MKGRKKGNGKESGNICILGVKFCQTDTKRELSDSVQASGYKVTFLKEGMKEATSVNLKV